MFSYIVTIVVSILAIFVIHWIIQYMKDNYTVKKYKEVGKFQTEKYDQILRELAKTSSTKTSSTKTSLTKTSLTKTSSTDLYLTEEDTTHLHMDLDDFIKSLYTIEHL